MEMSEFDRKKVERALLEGGKIEAIKVYREVTGEGLKEGKDFVDALAVEMSDEHPELAAASKGCGGSAVLLFALLVGGIWSLF